MLFISIRGLKLHLIEDVAEQRVIGFYERMIKFFSFTIPIFCITRSERLLGSEVKEYNSLSFNTVFACSRQAKAASVAYPLFQTSGISRQPISMAGAKSISNVTVCNPT